MCTPTSADISLHSRFCVHRELCVINVGWGRGCRGAMIPAKMISEPQWRHQASRHSVSTPRILAPIKKYLSFISTKNLFLKNSQHDEIVQNDTLTFCIKRWILIEIKGLYFVFLNFTNSWNCEELLQFCIQIEKCYIILEGSYIQIKQYRRQFTKQGSFCEILVFVILSYALENIEELFKKIKLKQRIKII